MPKGQQTQKQQEGSNKHKAARTEQDRTAGGKSSNSNKHKKKNAAAGQRHEESKSGRASGGGKSKAAPKGFLAMEWSVVAAHELYPSPHVTVLNGTLKFHKLRADGKTHENEVVVGKIEAYQLNLAGMAALGESPMTMLKACEAVPELERPVAFLAKSLRAAHSSGKDGSSSDSPGAGFPHWKSLTQVMYIHDVEVTNESYRGHGLGYFMLDHAIQGIGGAQGAHFLTFLIPDPTFSEDNAAEADASVADDPAYKAKFQTGVKKLTKYYTKMGFRALDPSGKTNYLGLWARKDPVRGSPILPYRSIEALCPALFE